MVLVMKVDSSRVVRDTDTSTSNKVWSLHTTCIPRNLLELEHGPRPDPNEVQPISTTGTSTKGCWYWTDTVLRSEDG